MTDLYNADGEVNLPLFVRYLEGKAGSMHYKHVKDYVSTEYWSEICNEINMPNILLNNLLGDHGVIWAHELNLNTDRLKEFITRCDNTHRHTEVLRIQIDKQYKDGGRYDLGYLSITPSYTTPKEVEELLIFTMEGNYHDTIIEVLLRKCGTSGNGEIIKVAKREDYDNVVKTLQIVVCTCPCKIPRIPWSLGVVCLMVFMKYVFDNLSHL